MGASQTPARAPPELTCVGPHSGPSLRRVGAWKGGWRLVVKVDALPVWLSEAPAARSPAAAGRRWGRRGSGRVLSAEQSWA